MAAFIESESSILACRVQTTPTEELPQPKTPAELAKAAGCDSDADDSAQSTTDAQSTSADDVEDDADGLSSFVESDAEDVEIDVNKWHSVGRGVALCLRALGEEDDDDEAIAREPVDVEKWRSVGRGVALCLRALSEEEDEVADLPEPECETPPESDWETEAPEAPAVDVERWRSVGRGVALCLRAAAADEEDEEEAVDAWQHAGSGVALRLRAVQQEEGAEASEDYGEAWQSVGRRCAGIFLDADEAEEGECGLSCDGER